MNLTYEDKLKATRISKALDEFFYQTGSSNVRSTDVYPFLANKGLVERDRHEGLHFRSFLKKLYDAGWLSLIPQCQCTKNGKIHEWRFYKRATQHITGDKSRAVNSQTKDIDRPVMTDGEIDKVIERLRSEVAELPKSTRNDFSIQQLTTRQNYRRAYEIWTEREKQILRDTYLTFQKIDKVAELLQRQPSAVKRKLEEMGLLL